MREYKAWPFREAGRIARRYPSKPGAVFPDRVRAKWLSHHRPPVRGRPHHLGPKRLRTQVRETDPPDLLQRRHGRAAQGSAQPAAARHAGRQPRAAAARGTGPLRPLLELQRPHEPEAARVPRLVRLRLRVPELARGLRPRRLRRRALGATRQGRRGKGTDTSHPPRGEPRALVPLLSDLPRLRLDQRDAGDLLPSGARQRRLRLRHPHRPVRRLRPERRAVDSRGTGEGRLEGRLGPSLVRVRGRLRDVGKGPRRLGQAVGAHRAHHGQTAPRGNDDRDVPRRRGTQDLQQRRKDGCHRRRVDAVRPLESLLFFLFQNPPARQTPALGHRPQVRRRLPRRPARLPGNSRGRAARERAVAHPRQGGERAAVRLRRRLDHGQQPDIGAGNRVDRAAQGIPGAIRLHRRRQRSGGRETDRQGNELLQGPRPARQEVPRAVAGGARASGRNAGPAFQLRERRRGNLAGDPFDVARAAGKEPKELFRAFYEVVLGQERGPRFGSFVSLVGKERVLEMLEEKTA